MESSIRLGGGVCIGMTDADILTRLSQEPSTSGEIFEPVPCFREDIVTEASLILGDTS